MDHVVGGEELAFGPERAAHLVGQDRHVVAAVHGHLPPRRVPQPDDVAGNRVPLLHRQGVTVNPLVRLELAYELVAGDTGAGMLQKAVEALISARAADLAGEVTTHPVTTAIGVELEHLQRQPGDVAGLEVDRSKYPRIGGVDRSVRGKPQLTSRERRQLDIPPRLRIVRWPIKTGEGPRPVSDGSQFASGGKHLHGAQYGGWL